jgi:hypothetical protein
MMFLVTRRDSRILTIRIMASCFLGLHPQYPYYSLLLLIHNAIHVLRLQVIIKNCIPCLTELDYRYELQ